MRDVIGQTCRPALARLDHRDFRRAAANVEQHDRTRLASDQRRAAGNSKPRFRLAIDDFELQPRFGRHTRQKFLAILRRAAGLGRDQAALADIAGGKLRRADLQRFDRPLHGVFGKPAAGAQPLAKPNDSRESVHNTELPGLVG